MIDLLISGYISRKPVQRIDKNGKYFAITKVRVPIPESHLIARIITFNQDLINRLVLLKEGDPISIFGPANIVVAKNHFGKSYINLDIVASRIA